MGSQLSGIVDENEKLVTDINPAVRYLEPNHEWAGETDKEKRRKDFLMGTSGYIYWDQPQAYWRTRRVRNIRFSEEQSLLSTDGIDFKQTLYHPYMCTKYRVCTYDLNPSMHGYKQSLREICLVKLLNQFPTKTTLSAVADIESDRATYTLGQDRVKIMIPYKTIQVPYKDRKVLRVTYVFVNTSYLTRRPRTTEEKS